MRKIQLLLICIFFLQETIMLAQVPFFHQYHPLKKNQSVQVNALFQDARGFIWLGTDRGLFRFDGTAYKHFTATDSLSDNDITALAEDSLGRIWMGHRNGMLSWLENGIVHSFETREGPAVEPVSDILFDRNGIMWFSTLNDGLYYYSDERLYRIDEDEGLPDLFIYDLYEDPSGNIWAGTDAGLAVCSIAGQEVKINVINSSDGLPDIIIKKIKNIDSDILGLATEDAGMLSYNLKTHEIKDIIETQWNFGTISDFVVKENQLWISTPRRGLIVYDTEMERVKPISDFHGVSLLSVNALLKDREGNIWSGSKTGLTRTLGDAVEHLDLNEPSTGANVLALTIDAHERIWFSTNEGVFVKTFGEDRANPNTKKIQLPGMKGAPVISLYTDARGFVWAGLYGSGLLRIHPENYSIKHFYNELRNGNILSINGNGETIWVATLGGASSLTFENGKYTVRNYGSSDGLSSDFVYQVFTDSNNRTWFATDGKGVSMLDENGFHHYDEGLASRVVYGFAEDIYKNIWVTSQDNGVYLFDGKRFITVPEIRLRDNSVQSIAADKYGNLIAMHNYGIDVYNIKKKQMRYWGEEAGIRDKQPNLNAVAHDRHGQLFVGTTRGIIKFSLNNDQASPSPRPAIDEIRVFDEVAKMSDLPSLKYNENNVTVHYLGFWYQNTENLNYLYKLENYDVEWISTRDQEVTYSRLPPGDYTFKLKASDTDDFTQAAETSITFSIKPPFWRTSTFYVLVVGFFFISAYGLMKFRERKLLEDKLVLETKVEERTREIQQKTEEIQAQNEEIMAQAEEIQGINENLEMLVKQRTAELEKKNKALEEYAFINAHKLRSPVASILGLVNLLAKSGAKDDTTVIREHLKQSADKLDAIVRSITKVIEKADNKF